MTEFNVTLPPTLQLGMSGGANGNLIVVPSPTGDWQGDRTVLLVYGLFQNCRLEDIRSYANKRQDIADGLAFADTLIHRWNDYERLQAALVAAQNHAISLEEELRQTQAELAQFTDEGNL